MPKYWPVAIWLFLCDALHAGTLSGSVTDATFAPAPAAVVELLDEHGYSRRALTGTDGGFQIQNVPAGKYVLCVTLPGFAAHRSELLISEAQTAEARIVLEPAEVHSSVTVSAVSPAIAGEVIERRLLAALPALSPD